MSPRCSTTKVRISSLFSLHLRHENPVYNSWLHLTGTGHSRHLPSTTAHHALPVAHGRTLLPWITPPVRVATTTEAAGSLHPQLSRTKVHTAPCQDNLRRADVAHHPLLRPVPIATGVAQGAIADDSRRRDVAHSVVQDNEMIPGIYSLTTTTRLLGRSGI